MPFDETQLIIGPNESDEFQRAHMLLDLYPEGLPRKWQIAEGINVVGYSKDKKKNFPAKIGIIDYQNRSCTIYSVEVGKKQSDVEHLGKYVSFRELMDWNKGLQLPGYSKVIKSHIQDKVTRLRRLLPDVFKTS